MKATLTMTAALLAAAATAQTHHVYIGTYTGGESKGIYLLDYDAESGAIESRGLAAEIDNPSFLAHHPTLPVLYAVGELGDGGGAISAFRIDAETGLLTLINRQSSKGDGPCHVAVAPNGRHAAIANYGGGSVALFPLGPDGALAEASAFVQHTGSGPNEQRQTAPHAHAVYFDPGSRFLYAADLGIDKLLVYAYDAKAGTLEPRESSDGLLAPGAGPRHAAFHPNGKFAYVVNELDNTVTVFSHDSVQGRLAPLGSVPTLPEGFTDTNSTAEIVMHPNGKTVYASNRGHDSIAVYAADGESGHLTPLGQVPTGGQTPRNFALDPAGGLLLAANQNSDTVVVFRINQETGIPEPAGQIIAVPKPVCVLFVAK